MDSESTSRYLALEQAFAEYARRWSDEAETVARFWNLLADDQDPFQRARLDGHFTASAWLVSGDGRRVLLTHHRKLNRWLQLGGHADGDTDLARAALREAEEESGLTGLTVDPEIFDLDVHLIPARTNEPEHWHFDVRYVVRASDNETFVVSDESHDLAWREIQLLIDDDTMDVSVRRMAQKWLLFVPQGDFLRGVGAA